jgi:hypothetical protein
MGHLPRVESRTAPPFYGCLCGAGATLYGRPIPLDPSAALLRLQHIRQAGENLEPQGTSSASDISQAADPTSRSPLNVSRSAVARARYQPSATTYCPILSTKVEMSSLHPCGLLATRVVMPDNPVDDLHHRDMLGLGFGLNPLDKRFLDVQGPAFGGGWCLVRHIE